MTEWFQLGKFLGVLFLFAGFLVSIEVFREIRVPFTSIRLGRTRQRAGRRGTAGRGVRDGRRPADPGARAELTGTAARDGRRPYHGAHACPVRPARSGRPSPGSRSSSWRRRCSGPSGRCRASPTTPGWSRCRSSPGAARIGLIATAVFVAWRISAGRESLTRLGDLDRGARVSLAVAALCGFFLNLAMFIAFDLITVALALLGFYTYPVVVAVANVALGREALDRPRVVALALAVAGMVAVVASQLDPASGIRLDAVGVGLALGAAGCQAVFVIISRTGYRPVPAAQAMSVVLATTVVCSLVIAIATGAGEALAYPLRDPSVLPLLVFTGLFAAAIPSILFLTGIRLVGGTRAGILMLFEPVVGVALAALAARRGPGPDPGPRRPRDPRRGADPPAIGRPGRAHGRRAGDRIRRRDGPGRGPRRVLGRARPDPGPDRRRPRHGPARACATSSTCTTTSRSSARRPTARRRSTWRPRSGRTSS